MKPQNKYLYDHTALCPKYIFYPVGRDSFYVYSSCILAIKKIMTIGNEYVFVTNNTGSGLKMFDVTLIDCKYQEGFVSFIVRDSKSRRAFIIQHRIECPENDCEWALIDLNYFIDKKNINAIQSYCEDCNDPKKKTNSEINHKSNPDDLLEFDF